MKNDSIATKTIAAMISVQRAGVARDNRDMFVYIARCNACTTYVARSVIPDPDTVPPHRTFRRRQEHGCIQEALPPVFEEVIEETVPELVEQKTFSIEEAFVRQ